MNKYKMPRYPRRRYGKKKMGVRQRKRYQGLKRAGRKNVLRRLNSSNQGYLNINRRLPIMSIATATQTQGGVVLEDTTNDCIALGVPTLVPNGLGSTYDLPFSMTFQLDQLAGYTEFTSLFDQYKINAVKVYLRSFANTTGPLGFPMPWIECWNDHDSNAPPTVTASREIMGVKHKYFSSDKTVATMYVKPKPKITTGLTPVIAPTRSQWIDCTTPTIQHFSIKGIIHNYSLPAVAAGNNRLEFDVVMNASFKDVQ